jgi:branched-chain amino acid transport system ATP-binding protein
VLRVERLSFAYGDLEVLREVDLEVRAGEVVSVLGGNGAGKSTLLRNVSRLLRPGAGKLEFEGADLLRLAPHQVVALGVVHVPEGRRIFPELTVAENLRVGSYLRSVRRNRARNLERAFALFPRLAERRTQLGGTLSGGEQQMLAIARGLMADPKLLVLDEPSLGLAPLLARHIFEIVTEINRQGTTVLLVEQNVHQSLRISSRAYVLETGRVVLEGAAADLLADPHVKQAYLGM